MPYYWPPNASRTLTGFVEITPYTHCLGLKRFPSDDTIRNLFRKFTMGNLERLFPPLAEWQMARAHLRAEGYSLDLDSTVFERYGRQEGSLKGLNPRKHGRPTHHPLLAVLAKAQFTAGTPMFVVGCGHANELTATGH